MATNPVKKTLSLDSETIKLLEQYGINETGSKNLSNAVRTMVRAVTKENKEQ